MAVTTHRGQLVIDVRHTWPDGRRERIRFRVPVDRQSPRKAAAYERTVLAQLAQGIDPREDEEEKSATPGVPRLRDFWPDFIAYQASNANKRMNRPRTIFEAEGMFRRWLEPVLGGHRLDEIDAREADRLAAALESGKVTGRRLGTSSVANALGLLRRILSVARRWNLIERVPEIDVSKPKPDKLEEEQFLTHDEATALFAAANARWRGVFIIGCRTGLRLGELRALRNCDVDLDGPRLHVRKSWDERTRVLGPPKGGKSREVPLTPDAAEVLRGLTRGRAQDLVFPGQRTIRFSRTSMDRALKIAGDKAGINKHLHAHLLRHTYASHCVMAGIPSRILMMWGGWESEAMLARYAHLRPRDVEHWAARIVPSQLAAAATRNESTGPNFGYRLGTHADGGSKTVS
ncbi:MAG: site-specific integrase [Nannocystaceae bacterium]|nr:site-specific integrase [Nannocystaceae bacterium]